MELIWAFLSFLTHNIIQKRSELPMHRILPYKLCQVMSSQLYKCLQADLLMCCGCLLREKKWFALPKM